MRIKNKEYSMSSEMAQSIIHVKSRVQFVFDKMSTFNDSDFPQKKRLSEQAYEHIVKRICFGELKPGDRLVEADMAKRLGISTAPLREAIQKLHLDGWITNVPNKGSYVTDHRDKHKFQELFAARICLECGAFYNLAQRVTEEQLHVLERCVTTFDETLCELRVLNAKNESSKREKIEMDELTAKLWQSDMDIHLDVAMFAGGERLLEMLKPILLQSWLINPEPLAASISDFVDVKESVFSHAALFESIMTRDPVKAVNAISKHILYDARQYNLEF